MKKAIPFALFLIAMLTVNAQQVTEDNYTQLRLSFSTPELYADGVDLCGDKYLSLSVEGYMPGGQIGAPQVPVLCNLITVPFCNDMEVVVENAIYDTLHLGTSLTLQPRQPSRSKSDRSEPVVIIDEAVYSTDAFVGGPVATVEAIGIARDRRLAQLTFAPVSVNPVSGDVIVCRKADVTVRYIGADSAATVNHFRRYHTPAFSAGNTLNSLLSAKDANHTMPIRMVIVAKNTLRCRHLETFADWKRTQGMMVDVHYYTWNMQTQTSADITEEIADYLRDLYDNASDEAPAPTYLLLVGDNEMLPAFSSKLSSGGWSGPDNDHITDLYFTTWTSGDILPDCYQGRFSATDTATVANIVTKTMLYEKYDFTNDDYLARAALIAGVDQTWYTNTNDNGYTYADPNMDYAARFYINADHGFDEVTYYKNNTSFAPDGVTVTGSSRPSATASSLRLLYSGGVGWINYSAHGDWDEWSCPEFTVSQVNSMNNAGMPSFMIGNCCLSNKFDKGVCFGESLIRRGNKQGAIGYIGGTNSTYWTEDFYWSVGVRSNINNTMNAGYSPSNLGAYDRLFHTHGEDFSDRTVTAGKIVYGGNLAVQNSSVSATYKTYYWEIYELMGDPSLMPWLGKARTMEVTLDDAVTPIAVHTVPHAYVSLIDSVTLEVYAATFTDANGDGQLNVAPGANTSAAFLSAIAQGYKPFFSRNINLDIDNQIEAAETPVQIYPNPTTSTCRVRCEAMSLVQLFDCHGSLVGTYTPSVDSVCVIDVSTLPIGVYMVQVQTSDTIGTGKLIVR